MADDEVRVLLARIADALERIATQPATDLPPRRERMAVEAMVNALDFVVGMPVRGTRAAS